MSSSLDFHFSLRHFLGTSSSLTASNTMCTLRNIKLISPVHLFICYQNNSSTYSGTAVRWILDTLGLTISTLGSRSPLIQIFDPQPNPPHHFISLAYTYWLDLYQILLFLITYISSLNKSYCFNIKSYSEPRHFPIVILIPLMKNLLILYYFFSPCNSAITEY